MRTGRQDSLSGQEGIYESFSDMVLCTAIVLITLVVVLALNVVEQLNIYIEPNHFSGGATRPWLYIQAQNAEYAQTRTKRFAVERAVYGDGDFVLLNLFSPSSAHSATAVHDGQTVSARKGQTFLGQYDLSAYHFLQLAAGIDPGSFTVNGTETALMLPKFAHKNIVFEPGTEGGYAVSPDRMLALRTMALAWPVFKNMLYPRRAQSDYRNARTKIYVEVLNSSDGTHRIMIGHSVFTLPDDVNNGRLGWMAGFASGLTEVVYLGEFQSDPEQKTNKRIAFFEENGFQNAAEAYRNFSYPSALSASQKALVKKVKAVQPDTSNELAERYVRIADAQKSISAALVNGRDASAYLPPLLAYREAWQAYVKSCIKDTRNTNPPQWLLDEFLAPLGFDQAVVRGLRADGN